MSNFHVYVREINDIIPIPNAERIVLAKIDEYLSVISKDSFKVGDKVIYIPEQAVLPDALIEKHNLRNYLSGSQKNRVKAVRLRGQLSQGIILPCEDDSLEVGTDLAETLGIVKYEIEIPPHLRGNVTNANTSITMVYDIENFKNFPSLIHVDEPVVITEKIHGTCCIYTLLPENSYFERTFKEVIVPAIHNNETKETIPPVFGDEKTVTVDFFAASKGLSKQGLIFVLEENKNNVYVQTAMHLNIKEKMKSSKMIQELLQYGPVHILGEVFGPGIQDLSYNPSRNGFPDFRAFDVYVGLREQGRFLNDDEFEALLQEVGISRVPVLYKGPFSKEILEQFTSGKETVSGLGLHIREGVVVRPLIERKSDNTLHFSNRNDRGMIFDGIFRRVQLKSVSGDYLTRKNKNATEYQ